MLEEGKKKIMTASDYVNSGIILTGGDSERKPKNVIVPPAAVAVASGHKMLSNTMTISDSHAHLYLQSRKRVPYERFTGFSPTQNNNTIKMDIQISNIVIKLC